MVSGADLSPLDNLGKALKDDSTPAAPIIKALERHIEREEQAGADVLALTQLLK